MKILQEETSSTYLLLTESKYKTSENPLLFALICAFNTCSPKARERAKIGVSTLNQLHSKISSIQNMIDFNFII